MSRRLGVEITIGAVLASSVMSSLGSVTQKFDGLNGKIKSVGQTASATGKVLELAAKKDDLESRAAVGEKGLVIDDLHLLDLSDYMSLQAGLARFLADAEI